LKGTTKKLYKQSVRANIAEQYLCFQTATTIKTRHHSFAVMPGLSHFNIKFFRIHYNTSAFLWLLASSLPTVANGPHSATLPIPGSNLYLRH